MKRTIWAVLLTALLATILSACGSSGGGTTPTSTTVSGIAAAGAPIIGTVYIKDSKGVEKSVAVDATSNGHYSFDVAKLGLTAPFVMKAVGTIGNTQVTYCSAATTDDIGKNINITPFTDLIIASIANQVAANYYSSGDPAKITTTALTAQVEALANKLGPVMTAMGLGASTDLLRTSFTPGTNLDKMMDVIEVTVDPATTAVTIKNIIDNSTMTATSLSAMNSGGMMSGMTGTLTVPTQAQITDIDQINQGIQSFVAQFKTAMPSPTSTALTTLLDPAFMDSGRNRANFLQEMTTSGEALGLTAGPGTFISTTLDSSNNITAAMVEFVVTLPKLGNQTQTIRWRYQKTNGVWYALGNGQIVKLDFFANAYHNQSSPPTNTSQYGTGLAFSIRDDYNTSGVAKAVITGLGLPQAGLTLYNQQANTNSPAGSQFTIDQTGLDINNVYWLAQDTAANDTAILSTFAGANDVNIPYTVTLYDAANTQMAQYTVTISKRPYTYAELASAPFATLTKPAVYQDLATFQLNTAQTITWTLQAGTTADWISVYIYGANNTSVSKESSLLPNQTTITDTLTATFTPTGGSVWLSIMDQYKRVLSTSVGS